MSFTVPYLWGLPLRRGTSRKLMSESFRFRIRGTREEVTLNFNRGDFWGHERAEDVVKGELRSSAEYREVVFLLQFVAAIAMACTNYGYTLYVKTANGLARMKVVVTGDDNIIFERRDNHVMYYAGSGALCLMYAFNALVTVDATGKLVKFMRMYHKDEPAHLHETANPNVCAAPSIPEIARNGQRHRFFSPPVALVPRR